MDRSLPLSSPWLSRGLALAGVSLVLAAVACKPDPVEPYDYEDDDDAGMYVPTGQVGGSGGGGDDGSTGSSTTDGLEGMWRGDCPVDLYGYTYPFELELDIEEDDGSELRGMGVLLVYGMGYKGELFGSKDGDEVELSFNGSASGYGVPVELTGTIDGDRMTGICMVIDYPGTFDVTRDE